MQLYQLETRPRGDSIQGIFNLPWCLIGRVLKQVCLQKGQLVQVASVWKDQTWYPVDAVEIIPANCPNTRSHSETIRFPDGDGATTSCVVCPGNVPQVVAFRMRLLNSYCSPGDLHQPVLWLLLWKWACWCSERGHNPVSGSFPVVANFLAE